MGMTECTLIFDKVSSQDIGVTVEGYPGGIIPEKNIEVQEIPGRNGALVRDLGTYKNYSKTYTIHWRYTGADARIAEWLNKPGYKRLEDSFDPEHYRMAYVNRKFEIDNRMQVLKRADIEFQCKPQLFRKIGDVPISVNSGMNIVNNGRESLPLITIKGTGECSFSINEVTVKISSIPASGIVLDCELQDAYSPDKTQNLNNLITLSNSKFPTLVNGANKVTFTGSVESVIIIPRWWDLL